MGITPAVRPTQDAWTVSTDAFAWFTQHGGLTQANGDRFRDMILSRGSVGDDARMYRDFRRQGPSIEPMLTRRGIARP